MSRRGQTVAGQQKTQDPGEGEAATQGKPPEREVRRLYLSVLILALLLALCLVAYLLKFRSMEFFYVLF